MQSSLKFSIRRLFWLTLFTAVSIAPFIYYRHYNTPSEVTLRQISKWADAGKPQQPRVMDFDLKGRAYVIANSPVKIGKTGLILSVDDVYEAGYYLSPPNRYFGSIDEVTEFLRNEAWER